MNETVRLALSLTLTCVIVAFSLSCVYDITKPVIDKNEKERLMKALKDVNPRATEFMETNTDEYKKFIGKNGILQIYEGYDDKHRLAGIVLLVSGQGFGGEIKALVGIDTINRKITGIKILQHLETPGLGERITEDKFASQFRGKPLNVKSSDFNTITGATISSSAVINMVVNSVNAIKSQI